MREFPEFLRLPIARPVNDFVYWLTTEYSFIFNKISAAVLWLIMSIEAILLWLPWWLVISLVFLLGWLAARSLMTGLILALLLVMVGSFGLWNPMMQTLAIVIGAVFISLLIGIPIGILMAANSTAENIMKPVLDAMQTMPSFVYLIPAMMFFGLGKVPALFATLIFGIAPVIRLTNLGIRQVPEDVVEAGKAFGSTRWQLLLKVQIPLAKPSIMSGINQTTMMALSMVVVASMIGSRGLGEEVLLSISRIDIGRGLEAGLSIVALAIVIDRIMQGFGNRQSSPNNSNQ